MFYFNLFYIRPNSLLSLKKVNINFLPFLWKFIFNKPTLSVFNFLTKVSYIKLASFKKSKNIPTSLQTSLIVYDKTNSQYVHSKYSLLNTSFISLFPAKKFKSNILTESTFSTNILTPSTSQAFLIKYLFQLDWYYLFRYLMYFFNSLEVTCNIYLLKFFSILSSKTVTQFSFKNRKRYKTAFYRTHLLYI